MDLKVAARAAFDTKLSRKTYLYNFDPLKPHFYIVKLGFTGVYIIFLISAPKQLWVLVRNPLGEGLQGIHYFSYFFFKTKIMGTR